MSDNRKPHKAAIMVHVEVHEVLDSGECSGKCIPLSVLEQYGLKEKMLLQMNGQNLDDCLKKLKGAFNGFK